MRIGILTGGGDCPGLNAVIRAVAKTAIYQHGIRIFGIEDGFEGLIDDRVGELSSMHVSGILTRGGSILGCSNRCDPSNVYVGDDEQGTPQYENRVEQALATIKRHRLDAVIVIGGDGTMSCALPFVESGVPIVGVPKTIDNDIVGTEVSFGFLTAVEIATEALDRLHSTAASHHRVIVCELMGRNAGWLTLHAGVASGADVILIPEIPFEVDSICEFVESRRHRGRGFSIIACAEGARPCGGEQSVGRRVVSSPDPVRLGGVGKEVADLVMERTGAETRPMVLGHVQRGGTPCAADRVLATLFGHRAMELLASGRTDRMIVRQGNEFGDIALSEVAHKQRTVPPGHPLIGAARAVKTCFGDRT